MRPERSLNTQSLAEKFVSDCIPTGTPFVDAAGATQSVQALAKKIRDAELLFDFGAEGSTWRDRSQRDGRWRDDAKRVQLRDAIVKSLIELDRLADDEAITFELGGARPTTGIRSDGIAILLTGLPASGKSFIVSKIADGYGAYVIDPDYAKRKLPEYDGTMMGASIVHQESSALTLGKDYPDGINLLSYCISNKINVVRPMVGENQTNLEQFRDFLLAEGYAVHLCTIDVPRELATARALQRFLRTDRYVSLAYIFDHCANDPALVYYRIRAEACREGKSLWASLGAVSTSGAAPVRIDHWQGSPAELF